MPRPALEARPVSCAVCRAPFLAHHPLARCCSSPCSVALAGLKAALRRMRPRPSRDEWGALAQRAFRAAWREVRAQTCEPREERPDQTE